MSLYLDDTPGEGWLCPTERAKYALNPRANVVAKVNYDTLTFVDRDPCPKCGVRKDHGCKHQGPVA